MMTRWTRRAVALLAIGLLFGCNYSNPHDSQELPPTTRLISEPSGATVVIERLNQELETPCELPHTVYSSDTITVHKDGYRAFRGKIEDLPQVTRGTYKCQLMR